MTPKNSPPASRLTRDVLCSTRPLSNEDRAHLFREKYDKFMGGAEHMTSPRVTNGCRAGKTVGSLTGNKSKNYLARGLACWPAHLFHRKRERLSRPSRGRHHDHP